MPHLRAIEAQDGKASARLTDINGTPATIVVERPTSFRISYRQHKTAMGTCTTTSTNPDKIAYQKRSDARKRAKLTQSFRHSNACTKSHKHERQEGGPIDDTLFQDDDPHHQAAAETLETRVPRQKAQVRRMTLVPVNPHDQSRDPKARHRMEGRTRGKP
jgi:hypothetical protein